MYFRIKKSGKDELKRNETKLLNAPHSAVNKETQKANEMAGGKGTIDVVHDERRQLWIMVAVIVEQRKNYSEN